jgi:UDP-N-acetylmuramoyl-L-alanyl-D-glutamate--2,6-diaminopimelate ligase
MQNFKYILSRIGILSIYHFALAYLGAFLYGFPSRSMLIIAVTGTKGKSSTTEMIAAILETAGYKTALLNSIHIKIGAEIQPNTMRMSMPGRMYMQRFLAKAKRAGCSAAVLEMTSEGARQHRERAIALDALVFTNLAPEHIESHGSYEAYADAKFRIGRSLARSPKRPRVIVANATDAQSVRYLELPVETSIGFALSNAAPYESNDHSGYFTIENTCILVPQPGDFSLMNALAAARVTRAVGVPLSSIAHALSTVHIIPGRAERIEAGQPYTVIVDYAHTADSLEALYKAYQHSSTSTENKQTLVCVLGATGGGRDTWKRPVMGSVADSYCDHVIVTNEDPYDERPLDIMNALASGMKRKPEMIIDRRAAIARACEIAASYMKTEARSVAILITGKGTDPTIAGPRGTKEPWSDARVAREEIQKQIDARS